MTDRKAMFDQFRAFMGGRLTQTETNALDTFLDTFRPREPASDGISSAGIDLIKEFEGLRLKAYPDPGSGGEPWTIGIGTTVYPNGQKVRPGDVCTEAEAEEYLKHDLAKFEAAVRRQCPKTTQPQFDALVSFTYNLGEGNLGSSTLRTKHNAGDYDGAALEFGRWNRAGGKVMAGLTHRRAAEAALYRRPA